MSKQSGITLISLIVTIILLSILAGVTITASLSGIESAKVSGFVSEMTIIQGQVDKAYDKIKNEEKAVTDYGKAISELNEEKKQKANEILNGKDLEVFRYLDKNDLRYTLGVDGINQNVLINFETREVYSMEGVSYNNERYYSQYELPGGQNITNQEENSDDPDFTIEELNYGLYETINITDIVYNSNANEGKLYYGIITDDSDRNNIVVNYWEEMHNNTAEITKSGYYAIKLVDKADKQKVKTVNINLVNSPGLEENMVPVVYDENQNKWKRVPENEMTNWYDYGKNKWANVIYTGEKISDDKIYFEENNNIYVWIPRFAYNITYTGGEVENVDIKYLRGTSNISTDLNNISGDYALHPLFNGDNGEQTLESYVHSKEKKGAWLKKTIGTISNVEAKPEIDVLNYLKNVNTTVYGIINSND